MNDWKLEEQYDFSKMELQNVLAPDRSMPLCASIEACSKKWYVEMTLNDITKCNVQISLQDAVITQTILIQVLVSRKLPLSLTNEYYVKWNIISHEFHLKETTFVFNFPIPKEIFNNDVTVTIKFYSRISIPSIQTNRIINETTQGLKSQNKQSIENTKPKFIENDKMLDAEIEDFRTNFCNNMKQLQQEGLFTDIAIRCETEVFKAHRVILSARSPVFAAMFKNTMKETQEKEVDIKDIKPNVFRRILKYIYTNDSMQDSDSIDLIIDILVAADKYMLRGLKNACIRKLMCVVSVTNALNLLTIADLYADNLKDYIIQFICKEYNTLKNSPEWRDLQKQNSSLIIEILTAKIEFHKEQKQMLGERLFPIIHLWFPDMAGKITGMLLEIDNSELLHMLENQEALRTKVEEAVAVLQAHHAKENLGSGAVKKET